MNSSVSGQSENWTDTSPRGACPPLTLRRASTGESVACEWLASHLRCREGDRQVPPPCRGKAAQSGRDCRRPLDRGFHVEPGPVHRQSRFPLHRPEYADTTLSSLSWVLNAYTIVFAASSCQPDAGPTEIGRRRVFVAGLAAFGAGSLLCGITPSVPALIGARVVRAAGRRDDGARPRSRCCWHACRTKGRTAAIGTWSAFGAMGARLGPVVGGALVQINWRWVFLINIPIGVIAPCDGRQGGSGEQDERVSDAGPARRRSALRPAPAWLPWPLVKAPDWGWGSAAFAAP